MTTLPRDTDNNPIPALGLRSGGGHQINATSSSNRNAVAFNEDTRVISIYATDAIRVNFGDATVVASISDHYFPANVYYDIAIGGDKTAQSTHIAVLADNADCTVYISEKD